MLNYWNLLTVKQNLISSHICEKIWCVSSWNRLQFPNEIIVIMTTVVCLEAEDDLLLMMAIFHIKGLAIGVSLKLIFRFMKGCFGDINKMDGHIAWIFNSRRCSSGFKRTSLLQFLLRNTLRNCHKQVFRLCRADFKIACCVWVVMFVKQYTGLQEMLCDQYWNKFNIMQPVLVLVIETSFFSEITWLQRQCIDSLLKGLGASSYTVLSLCMIYCDFFQNFY